MINKKDILSQLEASTSSIKDLFNDLLDERKGFKYQITVKILLKKYKGTEIDTTTKTVINHHYDLEKAFQEFLNSIER